jgi:hypothetical protein
VFPQVIEQQPHRCPVGASLIVDQYHGGRTMVWQKACEAAKAAGAAVCQNIRPARLELHIQPRPTVIRLAGLSSTWVRRIASASGLRSGSSSAQIAQQISSRRA